MRLWESVRMALLALSSSKGRSVLTMLGVVIGVTAVVAMLSVGEGTQAAISSQIEGLGTNLLVVQPGSATEGGVRGAQGSLGTLTMDDATAIADPLSCPAVAVVATPLWPAGQARAGNLNTQLQVLGVTPAYAQVRDETVATGAFITQVQVDQSEPVAVLGATAATDLFGSADPLGQTVYIGRVALQVVGVLKSKGGSILGADSAIFVPISTAQSRIVGNQFYRGSPLVSSISVEAKGPTDVNAAVAQITALLEKRHGTTGSNDDFSIQNQADFLSTITQVTNVFTVFLASIAGISLLVGGIGIMNIMLVSVTERTREIGIRKAVGARRRDLLAQFLVEAMVLSLLGGLIGVGFGAIISSVVSHLNISGSTITAKLNPGVVLLAVGFSATVGVFFGVYPAWRAARLDPIVALRQE